MNICEQATLNKQSLIDFCTANGPELTVVAAQAQIAAAAAILADLLGPDEVEAMLRMTISAVLLADLSNPDGG